MGRASNNLVYKRFVIPYYLSFKGYYTGGIFVDAFIQTPHCPERPVTLVAIGDGYSKARQALEALNITTVSLVADSRLAAPVASHADMLCTHLGGDTMLCSSQANTDLLTAYGFSAVIGESPKADYPNDALYNLLVLGNYTFCAKSSASPKALTLLEKRGVKRILVKQGYTKCSCAVINKQAIISADIKLCEAARRVGIDSLLIQSGSISLAGYNYGFIGGCCGLIDHDKLAVCGNISTHPDGENIRSFCRNHGVEIITLYNGVLEDIGSILSLKQVL